jgi:hypothetical protein
MAWRGAWLGAFREIGLESHSATIDHPKPAFKDQKQT